jgi:hypothetical protein
MADVFTTVLSGILKKFVDLGTHHAEVVAVVNPDGSPISGGSSSQSTVDFVDELYTVIQAWPGATLGSTVTYRRRTDKTTGQSTATWVNASDVVIADPPSPLANFIEAALPAKQTTVLAVIDSAGIVWRQFTNTATGGVTYYDIGSSTKGTPTGDVKPFGGTAGGIQPVPLQGNANHVYSLPVAPTTLTGAYVLRNGVSYPINGVDWTVAGTTLTIVNAQAKPVLNEIFFFNWFA